MLWYIIDGWNLIHKVPSIKNKPDPKAEFISFIKRGGLTGSKNNKVTVVFDGKIDLSLITSEKEFEIVFSGDKSADSIICAKVRNYKNKRQVIVVSDDRQVINYIKSEGASSLKAEMFLRKKEKKTVKRESKDISYTLQKQINEELSRIWLKPS